MKWRTVEMDEQTDRHTDWLKSLCTADVEKACMDLSVQSNGMAAFRNIPTHTVFTGVYCQKENRLTYSPFTNAFL